MEAPVHVCEDGADIGTVHVFDLSTERATAFAAELSAKYGLKTLVAESAEAAVRAADIVMPATTHTDPSQAYIRFDWLKPGTLFIDLSIWDAEY